MISYKKIIKHRNFLLCLFALQTLFQFVGCSGNLQNTNSSSKTLSITYLGFNTTLNNYFVPGKKVELLARANKKNVTYSWDIPGDWKEISGNKVIWIVPEQEGEYKISVTARDEKNIKEVSRSLNVTVADEAVCAAPDTFSCKIITKTVMKNKLVGTDVQKTVSKVQMNADDSVYVETVESNGEVTRTFTDSEAVYDIDENGNRKIVARRSFQDSFVPSAKVIGLSTLKNACKDYEYDGRFYNFKQASGKQKAEVEYDSKLGVVTRIRSEDEDNMEVSDMKMEYDVIDGYIVTTKVSGTVTYYVFEEKFTTQIEQKIKDVILNQDGEE